MAQQLTLFDNPTSVIRPDESFIEAKLANALASRGIRCIREHPVGAYRADFAFPGHRLIVEVDGYEFHHTRKQREHDTQRDQTMALAGWRVVRFTGSQIYRDVDYCVAVITLLLKTLANPHQETHRQEVKAA